MPSVAKRPDGLVERCRVINGKKRHFYGRTLREVQAKIDAAVVEASIRREKGDPFREVAEAFHQIRVPPGLPPQSGSCHQLVWPAWHA